MLLFLHLIVAIESYGDIHLPRLIGNGMVLQRDSAVLIWGWADAGENISLTFQEKTYSTQTNQNGHWQIKLSGLKTGGPYQLQLQGKNLITINDVLVGDVWVCSGQSNMELPMRRIKPKYEEEILKADNPYIRQFTVPQKYDFKKPHDDLESGQWKPVNSENILDFSAIAYFFAKNLYEAYHVPIGLINSSLGGSPAEAWLSEDALKQFPNYYKDAQLFKNDDLIKQIENSDNERIKSWYTKAQSTDAGYKQQHWGKSQVDISTWPSMNVPGYWTDTKIGDIHGVVWFRKEFIVEEKLSGKKASLNLGAIIDADSVWINGIFIGNTTYMYPPRWYTIPENILKKGENSIAIRVVNERGKGGFVLDKPYEIVVEKDTLNLSGLWKYKLGTTMPVLDNQTFIRWKPLGLYNAMIAPLLKYRIKGVIWYQGESNVSRAKEYRELFPAMVRNWRNDWRQGNFPFLFVQLANFTETKDQPSESDWAMLREAQAMCLALPNTGMAVTTDIGEWNDIHPLNKTEVGKRLSLAARHIAYGEDQLVFSGPVYKTIEIKGREVILNFEYTGSGLMAKNGTLKGFSISDKNKKFVWAEARIEGNKVIVYSKKIKTPVAVRYAWADNPQSANLFNKEGLPAAPFRTDNW